MKAKTFMYTILTLLFLSGSLEAEIDQIRFGSTGDPLNGLTITWRGNYSNCKIKWGYSPAMEQGTTDITGRAAFGSHSFKLFDYSFPKLKPCSTIYYAFQEYNGRYEECQCKLAWTKPQTVKTSQPVSTKKFSFIAGGDSRGKSLHMETWGLVAGQLAQTDADFYIFVGDLALQGGDKRMWESWFAEGKDFVSQKLVYHCIGNHETYGDPSCWNFIDQLVMPENGDFTEQYYSFEYGNAVFITLNTEYDEKIPRGQYLIEKQNIWLENQLKKYREKKGSPSYKEWVIVTFHRPFFTIDKHMGEMTGRKMEKHGKMREYPDYSKTWWLNLFDKYNVDVIINGHTHAYMRAKPMNLERSGQRGHDLKFYNGFPEETDKIKKYGNQKGQGRMQIVTGGYGAPILTSSQLLFKEQWYVQNYKQDFHYCQFTIEGKKLSFEMKRIPDNKILDRQTIIHD